MPRLQSFPGGTRTTPYYTDLVYLGPPHARGCDFDVRKCLPVCANRSASSLLPHVVSSSSDSSLRTYLGAFRSLLPPDPFILGYI